MLLQDIDTKPLTSAMQKYGVEAEKQMAFYLKRAFQNSDVNGGVKPKSEKLKLSIYTPFNCLLLDKFIKLYTNTS